jgi:hypothetical protein
MHLIPRLLRSRALGPLVLGLAATGLFVAPGSALAGSSASRVIGHVYLDGNTASPNTVAAYDRHTDGSLTPTPGSPFAVGGAGLGTAGLASQGAIQLARSGRYLLAADAGSNQISVAQVGSDGSLRPAPGGVVSSGGVEPDSIAVHGGLVYVANAGNGGVGNYTGFRLSSAGQLVPIPGSTVALPAGAAPGDVLFNADGTKLVGTRVGSSQIDSFTVNRNQTVTAAPGSPFAAQGLGPFGSEFRPTNPDQLFVSNAHNGPGLGTISAYDDTPNGILNSIGGSPFADRQTAPCWVAIGPDGRVLFAVNTGSGNVSRYSIAPDGSLTLLGTTPVSHNGGVGGTDPAISPDGRNLYINETAAHGVAEFAVRGGDLTELPGSPVPLPAGITAAAGAAAN